MRCAVADAPPGSIIVVTNGGDYRSAMFGDVLCQIALARGLAALVTDGAVRDTDRIRELRFPVFAAGVTPRRPDKHDRGQEGGTIAIADATVSAGDWIVGDGDGVVVVPATAVATTLARAEELRAQEHELVRRAVATVARTDDPPPHRRTDQAPDVLRESEG